MSTSYMDFFGAKLLLKLSLKRQISSFFWSATIKDKVIKLIIDTVFLMLWDLYFLGPYHNDGLGLGFRLIRFGTSVTI